VCAQGVGDRLDVVLGVALLKVFDLGNGAFAVGSYHVGKLLLAEATEFAPLFDEMTPPFSGISNSARHN
jgi:hypothetical protein